MPSSSLMAYLNSQVPRPLWNILLYYGFCIHHCFQWLLLCFHWPRIAKYRLIQYAKGFVWCSAFHPISLTQPLGFPSWSALMARVWQFTEKSLIWEKCRWIVVSSIFATRHPCPKTCVKQLAKGMIFRYPEFYPGNLTRSRSKIGASTQ